MKLNQTTPSNVIFETIVKELAPSSYEDVVKRRVPVAYVLQDLVIGVFVVVNISRMANNPPPVPYIDTNSIRVALNEKDGLITKKVVEECATLLTRVQAFTSKNAPTPLVVDDMHIYTLKDIIANELTYVKNPRQFRQISGNLLLALQYFENISAASLIGTLHYTDALSKYNTTDAVCAQHTFRKDKNVNSGNTDYEMLLPQLGLKDVVNGDLYCSDNNCLYQEPRLVETINP
jgi:hypothetical protein